MREGGKGGIILEPELRLISGLVLGSVSGLYYDSVFAHSANGAWIVVYEFYVSEF